MKKQRRSLKGSRGAKKTGGRIRKSSAPARQQRRKGGPPPDDPLLRHRRLSVDRLLGATDGYFAKRRVAALAARAQKRAGRPTLPPVPGGSNWVQIGPMAIPKGQTYSAARVLVTGRVCAIAVDPAAPANIYIGTAKGGVWKTTDGGATWSPMSDQEISLSIGALTLDPTNPAIVYAGTGEGNMYYLQSFINEVQDSYYGAGLLKSTDGGAHWTLLGAAEFSGAAFFRIAIHPSNPNTVWAATSAGLFRSTNGGGMWTQMTNGLPTVNPLTTSGCTDAAISPTDPDVVFTGFWGSGVYKTSNASAANPSWSPAGGGLPTLCNRVSIGISPSNPQRIYAAMNSHVYASMDGGGSWSALAVTLSGCNFESYSGNVAVDPATPDTVYVSGYPSLYKLMRDPVAGTWTAVNTGLPIHPDNHSFAFDPSNHLTIYSGCDGGIYKSSDGGSTWTDSINRGICITQFEFLDQHPTSDAVVFSGTQDNGTEQFRNSPVFNHADDGDGGFVAIDQSNPHNVIHEFYDISPTRSTAGGKFGTWSSINAGLSGSSLFYPPFAMDETNSNNIAFGAQKVFIDNAQGTGGWPQSVTLPGATGFVSAIDFVNSNLIYAGTIQGEIYKLTLSGGVWTAVALHASPLPARFIWDIDTLPADPNTVIVVVSGFGTGHVWRGVISGGSASWSDISGTGATAVPDVPANAIVIDPAAPATFYVGTDIGVYRTTDGGATWNDFGEGLPNSAVYDLRLHDPTRLLRCVTHGRGMWERRLDTAAASDVDLYVRDHLMHTGRGPTPEPVSAAFEDPLQYVSLGDRLAHWMCADIKVDALEGAPLSYQMPVSAVDFVNFEAVLQHRNAERGNVNRVYVQLHNRGITPATGVTVKLHFADASAGLPPLPADFWTAFPGDSADTTHWHPIGVKTVDVSPTVPTVVEWDWTTPLGQATHSCLFVVIDSAQDPIPAANKIFNVDTLVRNEKRVGLKNLHIVDAPPAPPRAPVMGVAILDFWPIRKGRRQIIEFRRFRPESMLGLLVSRTAPKLSGKGIAVAKPTRAQLKLLRAQLGKQIEGFDMARLYSLTKRAAEGAFAEVAIPAKGMRVALVLSAASAKSLPAKFQVFQREGNTVVGGSDFVLRMRPLRRKK
jgi:photosystem II stability/assembly factor-like uncharacterized protein